MAPETFNGEQGNKLEMVPANPDPEEQHQDSEQVVAAAARIEEALSTVQPLRERISQLLGPAGPHRVVLRGDAGRRCLAFMETELNIIAAFLTSFGPQHLDREMMYRLQFLRLQVLHELDPPRPTLLRRATQCFHRRRSYSPGNNEVALYYISEQCRSMNLLLAGSDLGLVTLTPQPAEAGALLPLVGIDRPAMKIFRWFTHQGKMERSQLRVMSIVGPVGIGKTTLAMEVRNRLIRHETSSGGRHYFHFNVMAQASRRADRNILLLQDILSQVSNPAGPALSSHQSQCNMMELLLTLVSECLQHKRYFIIIDDLCEESDWEEIKGAFPNNNLGSRILVTTRVTSVADACCSGSYDGLVHKMKPLNEIESERLLLSKAVGYEDGFLSDNMKLLCNETLRKCDGIPLFIIGMADWLKEQQLQQREDEDAEHQRVAMHYEEQVPRLPERLEQALSSAFNVDVPEALEIGFPYPNLRLLLLYMSMFPYGYKFEKDRLIWKWIDEGFIRGLDESKSAAERFFSQLVDRNVITCVASTCKHKQDEGNACQWQVNHLFQQFLASKSAEMSFIFTATTLNLVAASAADRETSSRMPRRLALNHQDPQLPSLLETMDLSQTRSLSVSGTVSGIPLDKFINLVVLDLEGWENLKDEDLLQVCRSKMFFLSYLSVRNTRVSKLPHDIKELRVLSTLDVSYTQITELPLELFELTYLEHLDLRGTRISQLPKKIVGLRRWLTQVLVGGEGKISSVETSTRLPNDVQHLYKLRTLATIDLIQHPASFVRALGDLEDLRVLAFIWSFHQSTDRECCEALLSSIGNWRSLESLTIHCGLGCSMEFLGSLQKSGAPQELEKFKVTAGGFASVPRWINGLKCLALVQITVCNNQTTADDLKILGALPKLQCLILGLDFIPGQTIVIETQGFRKLQRFSLDCPMPWLTFQTGAMPLLTYLRLKFSSGPASEERVPSGITNLQRISEVVLSYSKWCVNSTSVKMTVKAVREQVAKHHNPIGLFINDIEDHDVQAEDATGPSSRGTDARPGRDDAHAVEEVATGVAQSEITVVEN